MSFRCTNSLIGTIRHRLALEAAHRQLIRRTFTGCCNGIEVICSAYGTVLSIKEVDTTKSAILYKLTKKEISDNISYSVDNCSDKDSQSQQSASESSNNINKSDKSQLDNTPVYHKSINYEKLAESIQLAIWQAIRQIQRSKEQAHFRSLRDNNQLLSEGRLNAWYEHDSTTMYPRPFDALKEELATPWMQAVRFGKHNANNWLLAHDKAKNSNNSSNTTTNNNVNQTIRNGGVSVLSEEDTKLQNIPIASLHPHYTPTLIHLERGHNAVGPTHASMHNENNQSHITPANIKESNSNNEIDTLAVLREYAHETSRDEQLFWDRVELIRRGQLATLPKNGKRAYNDRANKINNSAALAMSAINEKIELRFTN